MTSHGSPSNSERTAIARHGASRRSYAANAISTATARRSHARSLGR
jgi:hypothetical protein